MCWRGASPVWWSRFETSRDCRLPLTSLRVSVSSLRKATRVLKAFSGVHVPLLEVSADNYQDNLGVLFFASSALYQADDQNETGRSGVPSLQRLLQDLERNGIMSAILKRRFEEGARYFRIEQRLRQGQRLSEAQVFEALQLRSTDFRILTEILLLLTGHRPPCNVWSTLTVIEMVMELDDDLASVEADASARTFNFFNAIEATDDSPGLDRDGLVQGVLEQLDTATADLSPSQRRILVRTLRWYLLQVPDSLIAPYLARIG